MSDDDRAFALGLIDGSAYPGAVAELAERVATALAEARAEGYAGAYARGYEQGAFDARAEFAAVMRATIGDHMRARQTACGTDYSA